MAKGVTIGVAEYILRMRDEFTAGVQRASQMVDMRLTASMAAAGAGAIALGNKMQSAFLASTKEAIGFESAFAGVRKAVQATDEEFLKLNEQIREMSLRIPVSAEKLAAIAEIGGQMGVSNDALMQFTETVAALEVSTNMTGEAAATMLAQFGMITQMPQSDFDNLASVITRLGSQGNATESAVGDMAVRIAAAGETAGMTEPAIAGIAAALANVGMEAEAGGTAMSKVINDITASVASGNTQLEMYAYVAGMTADAFAAKWRGEPAQALTDFVVGLNRMHEAGENVFAVFEEMGFDLERLRDTLLRTMNAAGSFTSTIALANQEWTENNWLTREAAERYATAESQLQLFNNNLDELKRVIGEGVLPVLKDMVQYLIPLVQKVAEFAKEHENLAIAIAVVLGPGGYLLDWAGQLAIALAGLKFLFGGAGVGGAAAAGAAGGGLIGSLGAAAAGIAVLGAQIAALIAVVAGALYTTGKFAEQVAGLVSDLGDLASSNDAVSDAVIRYAQQLENQGNTIDWVALRAMDYAQQLQYLDAVNSGTAQSMAQAQQMAAEATMSVWQRTWDFFANMWEQVSGWIANMLGFGGGAPAATQAMASGGVVGLPGFAGGGVIGRDMRAVMVGERGPEIAALPVGSRVLSHEDTMRALGGGGTTININNPVVREAADIDRLARAVSRAVASAGKQRMTARGLTPDFGAAF